MLLNWSSALIYLNVIVPSKLNVCFVVFVFSGQSLSTNDLRFYVLAQSIRGQLHLSRGEDLGQWLLYWPHCLRSEASLYCRAAHFDSFFAKPAVCFLWGFFVGFFCHFGGLYIYIYNLFQYGKGELCRPACENGGRCLSNEKGDWRCYCWPSFSGERCEVNHCTEYCLNGGTCTGSPLGKKLS